MTKEAAILNAAKEVFNISGFVNSKMDVIAEKAGCSKVTVYKYFESKENLYMAITYDAFLSLIDTYYKSVAATKHQNGLQSLMALTKTYIQFFTEHVSYTELIMNYRNIIRQVVNGNEVDKITQAMRNSDYYQRIKDIQLLPIQIIVKEIERGQADGSITSSINPWLIHHVMWSAVSGFLGVQLKSTTDQFINVEIAEWRNLILQTVEGIATGVFEQHTIKKY